MKSANRPLPNFLDSTAEQEAMTAKQGRSGVDGADGLKGILVPSRGVPTIPSSSHLSVERMRYRKKCCDCGRHVNLRWSVPVIRFWLCRADALKRGGNYVKALEEFVSY